MKRFLIAAFVCFSLPALAFYGSRDSNYNVSISVSGCSYPLPSGSNTVSAAYSLRKLRSAYAGNAAVLERASDSTTLDIGFVGCDFDAATAATFCAATTCTVKTLHEQSGSGTTDATDATLANQPTYIASCANGKPCYRYLAGVPVLSATLTSAVSNTTLYAVYKLTDITSSRVAVSISNSNSTPVNYLGYRVVNSACVVLRNNTTTSLVGISTCTTGAWYVHWGTLTGTLSHSVLNGVAGTDDTTSQTVNAESTLNIGAQFTATSNFVGDMTDVIVFAANISDTDAATVCRNSASYYGITTSC